MTTGDELTLLGHAPPDELTQASEDISKNLFQMKLLLYGDGGELISCHAMLPASPSCRSGQGLTELSLPRRAENDPQPEIIAQLAQEVYANDVLQLLVLHIWRFEFEVRPSWGRSVSAMRWLTCDSTTTLGKEGRFADLQQSSPKTDWHAVADGGALESAGGHHLCCSQGVSSARLRDASRF